MVSPSTLGFTILTRVLYDGYVTHCIVLSWHHLSTIGFTMPVCHDHAIVLLNTGDSYLFGRCILVVYLQRFLSIIQVSYSDLLPLA